MLKFAKWMNLIWAIFLLMFGISLRDWHFCLLATLFSAIGLIFNNLEKYMKEHNL